MEQEIIISWENIAKLSDIFQGISGEIFNLQQQGKISNKGVANINQLLIRGGKELLSMMPKQNQKELKRKLREKGLEAFL